MNGAVMKNFVSADAPFASALAGRGDVFVSEVDESDGSIALYRPTVAVLNNVSLDHKSLEELRTLFRNFAGKAEKVVVNLDDPETRELAAGIPEERLVAFSFADHGARLTSPVIEEQAGATHFDVTDYETGEMHRATVNLWGAHNARNGMAALAAAVAAGVRLGDAVAALAGFKGLRRRFEVVGERNGVVVIDDFGHNPDKIAATLRAARSGLKGRLLVFFQPHGFGPLKLMKDALIATFIDGMGAEGVLILSDPVYYGGTVDRTVGSGDIVASVRAAGRQAEHIPDRAECGRRVADLAEPGDRILIMGARDDTLSRFAEDVLGAL
jgi:UDP-N-acetylmuramate--alanine ligase